MAFQLFRHKSNGVVASYPEHYIDHPVFGPDLELYVPEEYEEDKVVIAGHEIPAGQRAQVVATPIDDLTVKELEAILKDRQLSIAGNRAELIARIKGDNTNEVN